MSTETGAWGGRGDRGRGSPCGSSGNTEKSGKSRQIAERRRECSGGVIMI